MSSEHPAPTPEDLAEALKAIPEGPNVEASPWEVNAARGETPLEGPRVGDKDAQGRPLTTDEAMRKVSGEDV